jgi:hypothetical protein
MNAHLARKLGSNLVWLPEEGWGYFPVKDADEPYREGATAADYFAKYQAYAATEMGREITAFRVSFVEKHLGGRGGPVLDIGIGSGQFIEHWGKWAVGYDINPVARRWLQENGRWCDPGKFEDRGLPVLTLWDVFEHLERPEDLLRKAGNWVFMSLPMFESPQHVLRSKHYRQDEHRLYFTERGLERFMAEHGFDLVSRSDGESELGREGIGTFAFRRRSTCP